MPFWFAEIATPLSPDVVEQQLRHLIWPTKDLFSRLEIPTAGPPFRGTIEGGRFKIVPVITYRNSFLPVIYGAVARSVAGGTLVRLRMRVNLFAAVFMAVWFALLASGLRNISARNTFALIGGDIVFLGTLLFGVLVVAVGFFSEALKAVRVIRKAARDHQVANESAHMGTAG